MRRILAESCVAENSQTQMWNCFELGNVGRIDTSLGCFRKEHPGYFVQEKKGVLVSY